MSYFRMQSVLCGLAPTEASAASTGRHGRHIRQHRAWLRIRLRLSSRTSPATCGSAHAVAVSVAMMARPGQVTLEDGLASDYVKAIVGDDTGTIWFATDKGMSRFKGNRWTTYTSKHGLPNDSVRAMIRDSSGGLWVGTNEGVGVFDGTTWTIYTTLDGLAAKGVYAIAEDSAGTLWFGTLGGVSRFVRTQ